ERAALILQMLGENKASLEYWKKAAAINPWMSNYQSAITQLLVHRGAWDEVGAPCRQWLRLSPGNVEARRILIEYLLCSGNEAEAKTEFSRLESLQPDQRENLNTWFAQLRKIKSKK